MWPFFFFFFFFFLIQPLSSHIPSSWMVRAGCVFVAGIHPSRTWTSGSFESVRWNACVHRLDLGLYSHPKEFLGNGVWTHVNSKGKIPSTENVPRGGSNPRHCGQRAQALPTELSPPPPPPLLVFVPNGSASTYMHNRHKRMGTLLWTHANKFYQEKEPTPYATSKSWHWL